MRIKEEKAQEDIRHFVSSCVLLMYSSFAFCGIAERGVNLGLGLD
jgi:hypothetical protein